MQTLLTELTIGSLIALAILATCGLRVYGWGALALGLAGAAYLAVADPGLRALVIVPGSGLLIITGALALLRDRLRPH